MFTKNIVYLLITKKNQFYNLIQIYMFLHVIEFVQFNEIKISG